MSTGLLIYTWMHVAISLVAIATGFVVLYGLLVGKRLDRWTAVFLATTVLTSATGFGFPFEKLLPSHILGVLSLILLAIALYARYPRRLLGPWRKIYVATAVASLYFNVFVLVVQSFLKIPALKALAPTQAEFPFVLAQTVVLGVFLVLGVIATLRFPKVETVAA